MNTFALSLALSLSLLGGAFFYLSSPHQRWRAAALPMRTARTVAALLSLAGLITLTRAMEAVPAVFTFIVWNMLLLVAFPYLGALLTTRRSR